MTEAKTINFEATKDSEVDVESLIPKEGKLKFEGGRPGGEAVYFEDDQNRVIAYLIWKPFWGSKDEALVESFTNETYRKKGLQERLNTYLIRMLRAKGYKKIIGQIALDNSRSFLNRLKTKDPDAKGVLKAEIPFLDDHEIPNEFEPFSVDVYLDLNVTVDSNTETLKRVSEIQKRLTKFRLGIPLSEMTDLVK